jgi:hypothetical protein
MSKVHLKDHVEALYNIAGYKFNNPSDPSFVPTYTWEHIEESMRQYAEGDLHYDQEQGTTIFKGEIIASYTDGQPHPRYNIPDDINTLIWDQFLGHIFSGANRLSMGFYDV